MSLRSGITDPTVEEDTGRSLSDTSTGGIVPEHLKKMFEDYKQKLEPDEQVQLGNLLK